MKPENLDSARKLAPLPRIAEAARRSGSRAYLVGGPVRDALLGLEVVDLDVAVEGEIEPLRESLELGDPGGTDGPAGVRHERFGTASIELGGRRVDLAQSRRESYPEPGALPVVEPASIRSDLARRDFTVNAMAVPLDGEVELIDPCDGADDLERGLLRAIGDGSFVDDPTRALRAARYAARLELSLEAGTEELLRATDLGTVSMDRVAAEWRRIAVEPAAVEAFALLREWGLLELGAGALELAAAVDAIAARLPWSELSLREEALIEALGFDGAATGSELEELLRFQPGTPSRAVELAAAWERRPVVLLLARAAGAEWLDRWLTDWSQVRLAIDGNDLIERGVLAGPRMGAALKGTLAKRLDGEIGDDPEEQIATALEIARAVE